MEPETLDHEPEVRADNQPAASIRAELRNVPETRIAAKSEFELREVPNGTGGTSLRFTGFACVTDAEYEMEDFIGPWTESVSVGAFKKTLNEGADAAFLLNHEGMTLARTKPGTLKLSEQTDPTISPIDGVTGLYSEALLDPQNMYVQAMRSAVDRGDLDEMSFAFRVLRQEWNEDWTRRWINEVSLDKGDVSLVNYGANPTTGGTVALRQRLFGRGDTTTPERVSAALKRASLFKELREGRLLEADDPILRALDALEECDDSDLEGMIRSIQAAGDALREEREATAAEEPEPESPAPEPETQAEAEPELEPEPRSAPVLPLVLPDHTMAARAALAAMRH